MGIRSVVISRLQKLSGERWVEGLALTHHSPLTTNPLGQTASARQANQSPNHLSIRSDDATQDFTFQSVGERPTLTVQVSWRTCCGRPD